jgi:hypothetical protein
VEGNQVSIPSPPSMVRWYRTSDSAAQMIEPYGVMHSSPYLSFSVHRWQAHLLDEGTIARVGMEKVESGVRLSQEQ